MGKNGVNNVPVLGFSISIIVSTMTQIGRKLYQHCVSIGILHIHYCANNEKKLGQNCVSIGILHVHYCVNNDTNWDKIMSTVC